jgi:hypothetical protein
MHTLITSSNQWTGTRIGLHSGTTRGSENAGVTEARKADPQSSGVNEGLPAFVSGFTILRADIERSARLAERRHVGRHSRTLAHTGVLLPDMRSSGPETR